MFRRRRREDAAQPGFDDEAAQNDLDIQDGPDFPDDLAGTEGAASRGDLIGGSGDSGDLSGAKGPWDAAERFPEQERMDFGSLQIPVREGLEVQINMAEDQGVWIAVLRGENGLQLQAFAAPKTSGLWDEVRQEIADEVAKSGGDCEEAEGPFGTELHARVQNTEPGHGRTQKQPVRFLGVDGPRWFLRGVISGPGGPAARAGQAVRGGIRGRRRGSRRAPGTAQGPARDQAARRGAGGAGGADGRRGRRPGAAEPVRAGPGDHRDPVAAHR